MFLRAFSDLMRFTQMLVEHRVEDIDIVRLMDLIGEFEALDMPTCAERANQIVHLTVNRYKLDS